MCRILYGLFLQWIIFYCDVNVAKLVSISNTIPRTDINGTLMDIHDGSIVQWNNNGLYYWYGMGYGDCLEPKYWDCSADITGSFESMCGFQANHTINIYSSSNLQNWTYVGDALPFNNRPYGIYYRPKVIYNEITKQYILWVNMVSYKYIDNFKKPNFENSSYIVAMSLTPNGPFIIQTNRAHVLYSTTPGDFVIFIDHDTANKTAYIAYDAFENDHRISIEQLTWNYLDSLSFTNSGAISDRYHEAPTMFKRNGWYYLLFGHCCCFCSEGADAVVYVSNVSAIGPYNKTNDINVIKNGNNEDRVIIHAQQNYIAEILSDDGSIQYLWTGDRWKSAMDGLKSHDLQYWQLLTFNDSIQPPQINKLSWADTIQINVV